jgi:hypothetical protein
LGVLFVTVVSQVIIIQFGGVVFRVAPLTPTNWGISIAIGCGSIVVGFCLRLLPDFHVPEWIRGGSGEVSPTPDNISSQPLIVEIAPNTSSTQLARAHWKNSITLTQSQVRVVKAFTLPSNTAGPIAPIEAPRSTSSGMSLWDRLCLYFNTSVTIRNHRRDSTFTLMVDPKAIRRAQSQLAVSKKQQ